jgi:hypothetical protein
VCNTVYMTAPEITVTEIEALAPDTLVLAVVVNGARYVVRYNAPGDDRVLPAADDARQLTPAERGLVLDRVALFLSFFDTEALRFYVADLTQQAQQEVDQHLARNAS